MRASASASPRKRAAVVGSTRPSRTLSARAAPGPRGPAVGAVAGEFRPWLSGTKARPGGPRVVFAAPVVLLLCRSGGPFRVVGKSRWPLADKRGPVVVRQAQDERRGSELTARQ